MIAMLMGQTAPSTEQSDPSVQVPSENAELHDKTKKARSIESGSVIRALFHQNTINQGTTSNNTQRTISSHDLRKAAKNYGGPELIRMELFEREACNISLSNGWSEEDIYQVMLATAVSGTL